MKAMLLRQIAPVESAPLELVDLPMPEPGPGEVRIRVRCCAVCRTDLHVIEGDLPQQKMPIIPGHQIVGTVDKLGPAACGFADGRRRKGRENAQRSNSASGSAWPGCGIRAASASSAPAGQENLCESARFTGYHADGGYAEYAVAPADFVYELPEAFSDVEAAPLLCSGIIGYRALRRCNLPPGGKLALYGFGSSAHVVIQIALHRGCEVYVVTRGENHRELARQMGAAWVGEDAAEMPVKVDSAIMFAPAGELVPAGAGIAQQGRHALAGRHLHDADPADGLRAIRVLRARHPLGHVQHAAGRPRAAGRGRRHPHPPAHDRLSPGRGEPGPSGPQDRPDQRHGRADDCRSVILPNNTPFLRLPPGFS